MTADIIVSRHYLDSARFEFTKLKALGDKAFAQLGPDDLHYRPDTESNSIGIIIRHLSGNMTSRWTDFLTTDGEKPDRHRDNEFEEPNEDREALIAAWEAGWAVFNTTLASLTAADMAKEVRIRGEKHSVIQALNRQLSHYGYHVGEIVYIARHIRSSQWQTLSIAKNKSEKYNQQMKDRTL